MDKNNNSQEGSQTSEEILKNFKADLEQRVENFVYQKMPEKILKLEAFTETLKHLIEPDDDTVTKRRKVEIEKTNNESAGPDESLIKGYMQTLKLELIEILENFSLVNTYISLRRPALSDVNFEASVQQEILGELKGHRMNAIHVIDGLTDLIEQRQAILQKYLTNRMIKDFDLAINQVNSNFSNSLYRWSLDLLTSYVSMSDLITKNFEYISNETLIASKRSPSQARRFSMQNKRRSMSTYKR